MKKTLLAALAALIALALAGCTVEKNAGPEADGASADGAQAVAGGIGTVAAQSQSADVVELTEKMYVTYINEIYTNSPDYLGRTIRLQGMFTSEYYEPSDQTYYYVYRVGPGCCGNDGSMCGFEFTWDGEMPQDNDWIEVTGVLGEYEMEGLNYLTLKASSVTVKTERGAENVYQ